MHDGIIGIPLKWNLRKVRLHPSIKRIMQKQVGQQWTGHATLRRALLARNDLPVLLFHWRFQPAFDIENHPPLRGVFLHRSHQEILIQVVEEGFDVKVQDPVISPTPLPGLTHRIQR